MPRPRDIYDSFVRAASNRRESAESEPAKGQMLGDRLYGSVVGATVTIGPVALGFAVVDLIHGTWDWGMAGFFAFAWVATLIGIHGWMWEYFVWRRRGPRGHETRTGGRHRGT